jgi:hypothetical protein
MMSYQQMLAAGGNATRLAPSNATDSTLSLRNSAGSSASRGYRELLALLATAVGVALAAVSIGLW